MKDKFLSAEKSEPGDRLPNSDFEYYEKLRLHQKNEQIASLAKKFRWHLHYVTIILLWIYFSLAIIVAVYYLFPIEKLVDYLDKEKMSALANTIVQILIGFIIGKLSNVLSKQ
ncbi:MAG: hypothetical protein QM529_03800 [Hydrotalea sp.]|nr:hypothetical protein [Hydrotalea sp.]